MRIYLDTCSIQRPLDSKTQSRIAIEAEAVLAILSLMEVGKLELVSSEALLFEMARNPNANRKQFAWELLQQAALFVDLNESIEHRAKELVERGLRPLDALHVAFAEEAMADFLVTCDDKLLKKSNLLHESKTHILSPLDFIQKVNL